LNGFSAGKVINCKGGTTNRWVKRLIKTK
jgi:hypothetical protein